MRTVIAHLWDTSESAVAAVLSAMYPEQCGTWVESIASDPCLYINIYRHGPAEDPDWATRFDGVGGFPAVSVSADISGRHNGWPQVEAFITLLLVNFRGLAQDDDSYRLWSLSAVRGDLPTGQTRFGEYWRGWGSACSALRAAE